jgi:hypothetical protein
MKFVELSHLADPDGAARKLVEIVKARQCRMGRIHIELVNGAFLEAGGTPDQYRAALARAYAGLPVAARVCDLYEIHARRC